MTENLAAVILAGGIGKRFLEADGRDIPKVLRPLLGRPMLEYVLLAAEEAGVKEIVVVVGHRGEEVYKSFQGRAQFAWQEQPMGTGHALLKGLRRLGGFYGHVMALCGDVPLITARTLKDLATCHVRAGADATVLTVELDDPTGYGRVIRGPHGEVLGIVEEKDAAGRQKEIKEVNTGTYCFRAEALRETLPSLTNENAQGEFYLTDVVAEMAAKGMKVIAMKAQSPDLVKGVNKPEELREVERILKEGREKGREHHGWEP